MMDTSRLLSYHNILYHKYTVSKQLVNDHNNFIIRKNVENRGSTGIMKFQCQKEFFEYNKTLNTYNVQIDFETRTDLNITNDFYKKFS